MEVMDGSYHSRDLLHKHLSFPGPQTTDEGKQSLVIGVGNRSVDVDANLVS